MDYGKPIELTLHKLCHKVRYLFTPEQLSKSTIYINDMHAGSISRIKNLYRNKDLFFLTGFSKITADEWTMQMIEDPEGGDMVMRMYDLTITYSEKVDIIDNCKSEYSINIEYNRIIGNRGAD